MNIKHFFENKLVEESSLKKILTQKQIDVLCLKNILIIKKRFNNNYFFFNFVGFLNFNDIMIIVFPKYILNLDNKYDDTKTLMKILERYFQNYNNLNTSLNELNFNLYEENFSLYSYYKYLLNDFLEFGVYSNHKLYSELNGEGDIDWEKTINETDTFITKNKNILYFDLYTSDILKDNESYIKTLHEYYLNKASKYLVSLNKYGFNFPNLTFQIEDSNLGTKEYRLFKLNKELHKTFSDRKIKLLKTLQNLIEKEKVEIQDDLILYGTTSFYNIWEKACGYVFKNEYNSLKKYIDKPLWTISNKTSFFKETLIPDILINSDDTFYILDAKYYLPNIEKNEGLPGIQDISKQYVYELAFSQILEFKNKNRKNIFLIPSNLKTFEYYGKVELQFLKKLGLQDILLLKTPVEIIFDLYCKNKNLSIDYVVKNLEHNKFN